MDHTICFSKTFFLCLLSLPPCPPKLPPFLLLRCDSRIPCVQWISLHMWNCPEVLFIAHMLVCLYVH